MTDTSLNFLMADGETELDGSTLAPVPATQQAVSQDDIEKAQESKQKALDEIVNVLMPTGEPEEKAPESEPKEPEKKVQSQPVVHNPQLLRLAGSWGIGPDEAARYADEEALLGAVALREIRWRNAAEQRTGQDAPPPKPKADDLVPPAIELSEDVAPEIKAAVTSLVDYTKKLKTWAEEKITAQRNEIVELRTGHEQVAESARLAVEARNAQLFDEKVAAWGEEFKELLGVPTQTWRQVGTPQQAEVVKLHAKTRQLAAGFAALSGRDPTLEELGGFIDEARYALWPDRVKSAVRSEIAKGARKQRGGVGLRPLKIRVEGPPEQGDDVAKAAIGDFMAEHGLDPWARRKAS